MREDVHPPASIEIRVFTHPACTGCTEAVQKAWELSEAHPEVGLRTVTLVEKEGLAEARGERVTTIPTLILSVAGQEVERWVGTPPVDAVEAALQAIDSGTSGSNQD